jgi:hypothetical protein
VTRRKPSNLVMLSMGILANRRARLYDDCISFFPQSASGRMDDATIENLMHHLFYGGANFLRGYLIISKSPLD